MVKADDDELRALETELMRTRPGLLRGLGVAAEVPKVEALARWLAPEAVLLEWMFLGDHLMGWAVSSKGVAGHFLKAIRARELSLALQRFRDACATPAGCHEKPGQKIADALLKPLAEHIRGAKRLFVVPYGAGHAVPFAALPFEGKPLGEAPPVMQLPSASVLPLLGTGAVRAAGPVLAVGNPTGDLLHAETEAKLVASIFGGEPLVGPAATESAVREKLAGCRLVLFATHGRLSTETPLASALALAGGQELSLYELMGLEMNADLVVLSACETGRGEITGGDAVVGLARGILAAGGRAVVVSLWRVDDVATELLILLCQTKKIVASDHVGKYNVIC